MTILFALTAMLAWLLLQDGGVVERQIGDAKERTTFHENGEKKSQVLLKQNADGKWVPNGIVQTWYPSGKQRAIQRFLRGVKHGKWESFYDNQERHSVMEFKDGEIVGEARHWYDTGVLQSIDKFSMRDDDLHVAHEAYHANGKLAEKGAYIRRAGTQSSLKTGTWVQYDEQGELVKSEQYEDGKTPQPSKSPE